MQHATSNINQSTMRIDPLTQLLTHRGVDQRAPAALMYHSISAGRGVASWPWSVSKRQFCDHLDYLADRGYSTVTVRELATMSAPQRRPVVAITFDDGYVDNLEACEELQRRNMRASWFITTGAIGQTPGWPDSGRPAGRMLNAAELRCLHDAGMEIGSHTVNHARLPEAPAAARQQELITSRAVLEDLLGQPVTSFAYPYGSWDEASESAVRGAGYQAACTTRTGWAMRDGDPLRIRRLTVFNHDSGSLLARKLAFASHDVGWPQMASYWGRRLAARVKGSP